MGSFATEGTLSHDSYARLWPTSIVEYHSGLFHCYYFFFWLCFFFLSIFSGLFSLWFLALQDIRFLAVPGISSFSWMSLKLEQSRVGHSHMICATFTPAHIASKINCRPKILWLLPHFFSNKILFTICLYLTCKFPRYY